MLPRKLNQKVLDYDIFLVQKFSTSKDKHRGLFGLKMTLTHPHETIQSEFDLGYPSGRNIIDNLASKWQVLLQLSPLGGI